MLQQDMIQHDHTFLFQTRKAEKNPIVRERILAVSLHLNRNMPVVDIAETMGCDRQSVYNWIARYGEHGPGAWQTGHALEGRPK